MPSNPAWFSETNKPVDMGIACSNTVCTRMYLLHMRSTEPAQVSDQQDRTRLHMAGLHDKLTSIS